MSSSNNQLIDLLNKLHNGDLSQVPMDQIVIILAYELKEINSNISKILDMQGSFDSRLSEQSAKTEYLDDEIKDMKSEFDAKLEKVKNDFNVELVKRHAVYKTLVVIATVLSVILSLLKIASLL